MPEGFTLWFTGLSGAGKTTIAEIVGPELERRGRLVEYLDGDAVRSISRRGSASRRRTATRTSSASAGSHRGSPGRAQPCSSRRSRPTRRPAARRASWSRSSARSSRCTSTRRSTPAPSATSRVSTRRLSPGEITEFTGVSDPYEAPTNPELRIDTEALTPDESAQLILGKLAELGLVEDGVPA